MFSIETGWLEALGSPRTRSWLHGVAYGPGIHISQKQLVERLPRGYELRQYPDISHSLAAMYPQPNWHRIWAFTHGRLVVNPSPQRMASIAKMNQNATYSSRAIGFGAYSEGASDDLNKCIWSALYLEPNTTAEEVVAQYSSHFFGNTAGASLLTGLEQNWDGDGLTNIHVNRTLTAAQQLDASSKGKPPNWRLQAHTFRAFYDAYVQARANWEMQIENSVLKAVEDAAHSTDGSPTAALRLLSRPWRSSKAKIWRDKAFFLAEALNKSLGGGGHWGGMAVLQSQDPTLGLLTIDTPTSNAAWLKGRLRNISGLSTAVMRKDGLVAINSWTNPGPGGFCKLFSINATIIACCCAFVFGRMSSTVLFTDRYHFADDNLGEVPRSTRLSVGFGPVNDPQFLYAPLVAYLLRSTAVNSETTSSKQRSARHFY